MSIIICGFIGAGIFIVGKVCGLSDFPAELSGIFGAIGIALIVERRRKKS